MSSNAVIAGAWPRGAAPAADSRRKRFVNSLLGHFWTIGPALRALVRRPAPPASRPFETLVDDAVMGPVRLTGWLAEAPGADTLVLIVHGLSGSADSSYCIDAARAARAAGFSSLRLSLRGADGSGEDILHGGLTADLKAALASPAAARYARVLLLGYSVGGHVALRAGIEEIDPRLTAVAAICPPLDLDAATVAFDEAPKRLYRRHVFAGLNDAYRKTAARMRAPMPAGIVRRARSCRERDALTVVPRFGFADVEDYYARASVAPILPRLRVPSLLVASRHDPIVPAASLVPALARAPEALDVRWIDGGGHVFFPRTLDLGEHGAPGLESQVMTWLNRH